MAVNCQECHADESASVLSALGVSAEDERRYQQVLPFSGSTVRDVAGALGVPPERIPTTLATLIDRGVVRIDGDRVSVLRHDQVLSAAIAGRRTRPSRYVTGWTPWRAPFPAGRRGSRPHRGRSRTSGHSTARSAPVAMPFSC